MLYFDQIAGFVLLYLSVNSVKSQAFGDDIDSVGFGGDVISRNEDNRFSEMGQVTKEKFDVFGGKVTLTLNVQDTVGIKEFWIIDFQPYRYNVDRLPIDETTGNIIKDNTGPCSNVFEDQSFDTYMGDDYFQTMNLTELAGKDLFTHFERGELDEDDNTKRNNKIKFLGDMGKWFDCTESDGQTEVWQLTSDASNEDELEYRTKVYAINVRPKDDDDAAGGISFVQSHIELIWRLSRMAISSMIISSTALLQPVLEFARVSAVYDEEGDPIPTQAGLHLRFRTVLDTHEHMVTYIGESISYSPDSDALTHGLHNVTLEPKTTIAESPACDFILDVGTREVVQCNQVWDFKVILTIDITGHEENRAPVDASGVFEFDFTEYDCLDGDQDFNQGSCVIFDPEPVKVAALITIQTVVFVQDEEDDQVNIMLVALKGADNQELSVSGARGIAHKENITLEVKFSPAVLRTDYQLDLLLFMVCRGEEYSTDEYPHGCLQAPAIDRYVAHREESFAYTPRVSNVSGVFEDDPYTFSHIENDYYQGLAYEGYVENDEFDRPLPVPVHRSTFVNLALSAASEKYVITNIYQLTEKSRRKREAGQDVIIAKTVVEEDDALAFFHGNPEFQNRYRRGIDDSINEMQSTRYAYNSLGCPAGASHDDRDCQCPSGTDYSTRTYQCEIIKRDMDDNEIIGVIMIEDENQNDDEPNGIESDTGKGSNGADSIFGQWIIIIIPTIWFLMK